MKRTLADFAAACGGRLHGADAEFAAVTIDTRRLAAGDLFLALPGAHADGHDHVPAAAAAAAAGAVVTRRLTLDLPQIVVADVATALAAVAGVWREQFAIPVIGVAGSNGKSTVKEMLSTILQRAGGCLATAGNYNNHLGVPLTLLRLSEKHRSAVVEIGANHAGEVAALAALVRPTIGVVTNAGAEHLEGFGDLEGAARAEGELFAALGPHSVAVINHDDRYAAMWRGMTRARVVSFGTTTGASVRGTEIRHGVDERGFITYFNIESRGGNVSAELTLAGRHNVLNALAAATAALAAGATLTDIVSGLREVRAMAGRMQFRRTSGGAWLIDDSYNANPTSALAAIQVLAELPARKWLVLGDMAELGEHGAASHRDIGRAARERGVERLYSFGALAALAAEEFRSGAEGQQQAFCFDDSEALARELAQQLRPDVCLLVKGSRVNRLERLVASLGAAPVARKAS